MSYYIIQNGELVHAGVKGMRWGVRRYQNPDGSLTEAGKKRYARATKTMDEVATSYSKATGKTKEETVTRLNSLDGPSRESRNQLVKGTVAGAAYKILGREASARGHKKVGHTLSILGNVRLLQGVGGVVQERRYYKARKAVEKLLKNNTKTDGATPKTKAQIEYEKIHGINPNAHKEQPYERPNI